MPQPRHLRIDFVSDVVCPWCVIGLKSLEAALARTADAVTAEIHFQPFELNPDMPPEGQDIAEHVAAKYGSTPAQSAATRAVIRNSAAAFGFVMNGSPGGRIWNTFDAHRLLHWAGLEGRQAALKMALFDAYFTRRENPADPAVLAAAAAAAGLDRDRAAAVLASDAYAADVRRDEAQWRAAGINAVPAVVIERRFLISGGQPVDVFETALRDIASKAAA